MNMLAIHTIKLISKKGGNFMNGNIILPRYPIIADYVLTYIKDGEVIKNRRNIQIDMITEILNFNNIAIEKNDKVVVWASKERYDLINNAKNFYSKQIIDIDGTIRILDKGNEHDDVDSLDDASLYMEYDMESYNN